MKSAFIGTCLSVVVLAVGVTGAHGQTLYATDGRACTPSTLYELNPGDGSILSTIGSTGVSGLTGLAVHPTTGVLYAVSTGGESCTPNLYTLNTTTGSATLIGPLGVSGGKPDMAFNALGVLYTYTTSNGFLGTVNLATGAMTLIGDTTVEPWDIGLTFDLSGTLIMTDGDTVYTVNTTTGVATTVASMGVETNDTNMMTTHPFTGDIYIADSDPGNTATYLYLIDPTNGDMTLLGSNGVPDMCAIAFAAQEFGGIPTLQTWGLILLGLLIVVSAVVFLIRR